MARALGELTFYTAMGSVAQHISEEKLSENVICIGSALWDIIACASRPMKPGFDVAGGIQRQLGGVALNVALALRAQGLSPALLTALGQDTDGDALVRDVSERQVDCRYVTRTDHPTDSYLAIEHPNGEIFGAIADCASLEVVGAQILAPLADGRLGSPSVPFAGQIVVDGNLPSELLHYICTAPEFRAARLSFVPASPGKATRLASAIQSGRGTLYVNRTEAEILCNSKFHDSAEAARALCEAGAKRAVVTDGPRLASEADINGVVSILPPKVQAITTTGAGDVFLAAHIAAEMKSGDQPDSAQLNLQHAVSAAAHHITKGSVL